MDDEEIPCVVAIEDAAEHVVDEAAQVVGEDDAEEEEEVVEEFRRFIEDVDPEDFAS